MSGTRARALKPLVVAALLGSLALWGGVANAATAQISSAGPLTSVWITDLLNCQVAHTGDGSYEFYSPGNTTGDCGTFLVVDGTLYGPDVVNAGSSATPRTAWTPVSQSAVTGSGTLASPFTVVTVVDAGATGIRVTETDSYVVGDETYRTDVQVSNTGGTAKSIRLYRAGDCYLQNSDLGYGKTYPGTGAIACLAADTNDPSLKGTRVEQWYPLTPGSHFYEDNFDAVWAKIGAQQPFDDTCAQCDSRVDNGAGLSWDFVVAAGSSVTQSHLTSFSPTGIVPLATSKTADSASASAGGSDGYTITISNPGAAAVSLTSITDTLPAGFAYAAGSTTGATTANPSVSGQDLTWSLSGVSIGAGQSVTLHFGVTVSCTAGSYTNTAGGTATGVAVVPVTGTAPVNVSGSCGGPSPDVTQLLASGATTQYSDPVVLSATLSDTTTGGTPLASTPVTFSFNSVSYPATTNGSGVATATVPQVLLASGTYPFTVAYAGDTTHAASTGGANVVVTKENCTLAYTGDTAVPLGVPANLSAQLGESDATHGDWNGKAIDFVLVDTGTSLPAGTPSGTTNSSGLASATQALAPGIYSVTAQFAGDTNYLACASGGTDLITVAAPEAKVTGGGFIVNGGRVSFGFNAISTSAGLSGQLQLRPGPHERFHGDTVTALAATSTTATWSGTGRWNGADGYTFTVTVNDNRNGGSRRSATADTISVTVRDSGGTVVFTASGSLKGGNITVH